MKEGRDPLFHSKSPGTRDRSFAWIGQSSNKRRRIQKGVGRAWGSAEGGEHSAGRWEAGKVMESGRDFPPAPRWEPTGSRGSQIPQGKSLVGQKGLFPTTRGALSKGPLIPQLLGVLVSGTCDF